MKDTQQEDQIKIEKEQLSSADNRPKVIIWIDRITWAIAVILVIYLFAVRCPCQIIENDITGEKACIAKVKGKEYIGSIEEIPEEITQLQEEIPNELREWKGD